LGWDKSVIHNFLLQTLVEAGPLISVLFSLLMLFVLLALWRNYRVPSALSFLGLGTLLSFVATYSLNSLPTLRVYWIPFGIAVGFSLWKNSPAVPPVQPDR
jgi:MFS superfamily sulfate permease-like transporter